MTYGIARAATSDELTLYRAPGKKSRFFAAIFKPRVIYTARINQVFTEWDGLRQLTFDGGVGTLGNLVADMTMYIGTTAGARDVGMLRLRGYDSTHFIFDQYSGIKLMDNQYITIVDEFRLLQRHISIIGDAVYMDGVYPYTDQHSKPDPTPIMGPHRVVKLEDGAAAVTFSFSQSYVIDGSSITAKSTSCPTAASVTGGTTYTPTVNIDEPGWHAVYLDLTAANGKTMRGVRYIYAYDADNMPPSVKVGSMSGNVNAGGYSAEIEMYRNAGVDDIYEGALVIIFSDDHWGETQEDICVVPGAEKIEMIGWIGSPEPISQNPERGSVKFTVQGPQYWMEKVSAYPDGVRFKISAPTSWEFFQNLTIDKGVWHFLHWRTTLTRILDFFPSGDTRYSSEVSSLAENLWAQLQEMTALQILARPGFNALGQLFIKVHPNLIPSGDRSFATVMDIEKSDWIGQLNFDRITLNEAAQINLSGIAVDAGGNGLSYFAVAPGHTYDHYGTPEMVDKLLLSGQSQAITLAGLYFSERNNPLPSIPVPFKFNIRLVDIFPNQKCGIVIDEADNVRGVGYSGGLIPVGVTVNFDDQTGRATREVDFEAETFESLAVKETVPGSGDVSSLPPFSFPTLPPFSTSLPGSGGSAGDGGPKSVLFHESSAAGMFLCNNFDAPANKQEHYPVNGGLTPTQAKNINRFDIDKVTGAVCVACLAHNSTGFIAIAPSAAGPYTILEDYTSMVAKYLGSTDNVGVATFAFDQLTGKLCYILTQGGENLKVYLGTGVSYAHTLDFTCPSNTNAGTSLSYGLSKWLLTSGGGVWVTLNAGATAVITSNSTLAGTVRHGRLATSGEIIAWRSGTGISKGHNNCATVTTGIGSGLDAAESYEDKIAFDVTGMHLMTRDNTGPSPVYSPDGGVTWIVIGNLPTLANWYFCCINAAQWIAVSSYIYYTNDVFASSPIDKRGNLLDLAPIPVIDGVKVVSL